MYSKISKWPTSDFHHIIAKNTVHHNHNTRRVGELRLPRFDRTKCRHSVEYAGVRYWIEVPDSIRNAPSLQCFKTQYRKFLMEAQWLPSLLFVSSLALWLGFHLVSYVDGSYIILCFFIVMCKRYYVIFSASMITLGAPANPFSIYRGSQNSRRLSFI